ncbi:hypothetical protein AB4Z43_32965 [Mesorhizobium sp. 2RAF45]|uniref:hypothetical protein n=1 Tax=Mesorhizobium sp. 2RAF45 TaxID=3233001 RepID=UPI003F99FC34
MNDDASIERRLRRLARDSGFDIKQSTCSIGDHNIGGYQLFERATNRVIAGARYDLDLKAVAVELQKLHVLGR